MTSYGRKFFQLLLSLACATGGASLAHAVSWFDDFNDGSTTDGNPVTWIENLGMGHNDPPFPGDYNASSGDYVLTPAPDAADDNIMASFVDVPFTDVYVRAQGIVLPDPNNQDNVGGNLVLLGRFDIATLSGYLVYFDVSANLVIQSFFGGTGVDIAGFDTPFDASSEVVLELNLVGDQLSAYAWLADDPNGKPAEPQVTTTDFSFTSGVSGVAFAEDDDGTSGIFRYATAQDTPFVDALAGDFSGNGQVENSDLTLLLDNWGAPVPPVPAGWTGAPPTPGAIDNDELTALLDNWGAGGGAGSAAAGVPEPGTLLWAMMVLAGLASVRRRGA